MKKLTIFIVMAALAVSLSGCDWHLGQRNAADGAAAEAAMAQSEPGAVPQGLKAAAKPQYPVGSEVVLKADHMAGMKGAAATVVGAYDTIAYSVTYTPTTGGEPVKNHKWVIQEEIKDAGTQMLEPGSKATLEADHMKGMMGASAVIDSAQKTTVYMVDYKPTTGGKTVRNHKWVIESELAAK